MRSRIITNNQLLLLENMEKYRYLTIQQALDIGISKNYKSATQNMFRPLKTGNHPLLKWENMGVIPGKGSIPNIHCLSRIGAKTLAEYRRCPTDEIFYPAQGIRFSRDALHRIATIDCHIALEKWAASKGHEVSLFDYYFDAYGNPQKLGQINYITRFILDSGEFSHPDAVFELSLNKSTVIYAMEIHLTPKTKTITEQLLKHIRLMQTGGIQQRYKVDTMHRVLSIHDTQASLRNVKKRMLQQAPKQFLTGFFFNSLEQVKADITAGWTYADDKPVRPFLG